MTTNCEQVGKALELARDGLRPFVERCLRRAPGGLDQVPVLLQGTEYAESEDPLSDIAAIVRLMLMSRTWYEVFQPGLRRTARAEVRNLVGEVGSVRNRWAHQDAFSDDDTERALDTVQRLLRDTNANQGERAAQMLASYRAGRDVGTPLADAVPAPPSVESASEKSAEPPSQETPTSPPDEMSDDDDTFEAAATREIDKLRTRITAKRAEREGLDAQRTYLEDDQLRIAREFEENRRRMASDIEGVDAQRREVEEEIQRLEARHEAVQAAVAPPPLQPADPLGEDVHFAEEPVEAAPASVESEPPPAPVAAPVIPVDREPSRRSHRRFRPQSSVGTRTADLVCKLLQEVGRPLHYREIYDRLRPRESNPPRSDDPATAYLARYFNDPRLVRTERGTYTLHTAAHAPVPVLVAQPRTRTTRLPRQESYKGTHAAAYMLLSVRYEVQSFRQILMGVCETVCERSAVDFEKVLQLRGKRRPYFSRIPTDLRSPEPVAHSRIFVETNESADRVVERCRQVLQIVGLDPDEFSVEVR